jgi:predicted  nucleic acid-binding Zn-ribbon protein
LLRANIKELEGTLDNRQLQLRTYEITCKEMESKIKTLESQVADDVNVARLLRAQVRALQEAVADRDQLEDKCKGLEEAVADCIANPAKDDDIKLAREQRDMAYQDIDTLQVANDELRTTLRTLLAVGAGK